MSIRKVLILTIVFLLTLYPTITIYAISDSNLPTLKEEQHFSTRQNTPLEINLTDSGGNVTNKQLKFSIVANPTYGTLSPINITDNIATITYTPNRNYTGPDSFTFVASNATANSNTGKVSIIVNPPNSELLFIAPAEQRAGLGFILSIVIVSFIFLSAFFIIRRVRGKQGKKLKPKFWDIIRDENWYPSLAIFQFLLWTSIVLFSYFGVYLTRVFSGSSAFVELPVNLLIVMGISAAVPVVSGVASQIKYGGTTPINETPTKQVPSDQLRKKLPGFKTMLMENDKITLPRFQMFAWTWISILVYLVVLFSHIDLKLSELWNISIPELNILFVALMGLSQGTYIATKVASADVFSINEIRPKKIQPQTENNLITILGSNFGDKGTVWIEYYPPLTDREKQDITDYHEEYNDEYVYDPRRIEEQFEPTIIKRENNRILASLDNMKDSLKIQNYVCRVEKDGLLTYASSDAIFEVTALPITKKNADIKLSCSKSEITVNGTSEISADVTKMDGSYADNVEVSFIISNTEIAEFKDNINKKLTDSSGLSNVTIKGKKIGDITVKATATLNSEIVEDSCDIKVIG